MKLCYGCQNVFKQDITDCPMGDCGGSDFIEVDDQMVDIVKGFMMSGIEPFTIFSCAGHVWKDHFYGYLTFPINPEYHDIKDLENFGLGSNFARSNGGTIKKEVQIEKVRDILSSIW
jgi:hypothetical protein